MGRVIKATPLPFYPRERNLNALVQEAGWTPGPVWTGAENLASTGIRSSDRPARSESLYRLSYPGPHSCYGTVINQGNIQFVDDSRTEISNSLSDSRNVLERYYKHLTRDNRLSLVFMQCHAPLQKRMDQRLRYLKTTPKCAALVKWLIYTFSYKVLLRPNIHLIQRKFLTQEICQQTMERYCYVTKSVFFCLRN